MLASVFSMRREKDRLEPSAPGLALPARHLSVIKVNETGFSPISVASFTRGPGSTGLHGLILVEK